MKNEVKKEIEKEELYQVGKRAGINGAQFKENPYKVNTRENELWAAGWESVQG